MRIYEVANEELGVPITEETTRFAVWGCDRIDDAPYLDLSTLKYHASGSYEACLAAKRLMERI